MPTGFLMPTDVKRQFQPPFALFPRQQKTRLRKICRMTRRCAGPQEGTRIAISRLRSRFAEVRRGVRVQARPDMPLQAVSRRLMPSRLMPQRSSRMTQKPRPPAYHKDK